MTEATPLPHAPDWEAEIVRLADRIRRRARQVMAEALARPAQGGPRPVGRGAGDVTYGVDRAAEEETGDWFEELSRRAPLSLCTEDAGWRHRGPDGESGSKELAGFDHGGPRLLLDPIDGTRNLMHDLRSAWTVVALAGPGAGEPHLRDVTSSLLGEIPDSRGAAFRRMTADPSGPARYEERHLTSGQRIAARDLAADSDDRVDHGFFPFFRYEPAQRPRIARVEAAFFRRLAEEEGADTRHVFDDQYISNGGQLALLALGRYRFIADLRAHLAECTGTTTTTTRPYDCAGAIHLARRVGCIVEDAAGRELDFPLDATTPVSFVGYPNAPTRERLRPHLSAALRTI